MGEVYVPKQFLFNMDEVGNDTTKHRKKILADKKAGRDFQITPEGDGKMDAHITACITTRGDGKFSSSLCHN